MTDDHGRMHINLYVRIHIQGYIAGVFIELCLNLVT